MNRKITFKKRSLVSNRDLRGSNQYARIKRVKRAGLKAYMALAIFLSCLVYAAIPPVTNWINDTKFQPAYAPTIKSAYAQVLPTATPTVDPKQSIRDEIKDVFGKDADKAFRLLKCENSSLNPNAVNTAGNFPAGSRDIGVFQINEHWQAVQGKFLFNPDLNIRIAHQLYMENGRKFSLWTCGRKVGI